LFLEQRHRNRHTVQRSSDISDFQTYLQWLR
jgi:hypothetical protein